MVMGLVISGLNLLQRQGLLPEIHRLTFRKLHGHYRQGNCPSLEAKEDETNYPESKVSKATDS